MIQERIVVRVEMEKVWSCEKNQCELTDCVTLSIYVFLDPPLYSMSP